MACFLVPTVEALAVTIVTKALEARHMDEADAKTSVACNAVNQPKNPFSHKLKWLSGLLWGGSALLAFEHIWHGEIVPYFPFLSAMNNVADTAAMLHEMSTVGVAMALLITAVWGGMLLVSHFAEKRVAQNAAKHITE